MITTGYGNWASVTGHDTPEDEVAAFGDGFLSIDVVETVAQRYRALVNDALAPYGIVSAGREFYGSYPQMEGSADVIREVLAGVDLGAIVAEVDGAV